MINTYWHHNNHLHFDILAMSVSCRYMQYCHGNSSVQMLISLETKSTPSYTQAFKTCRCANVHYVCPRTGKNSWFQSDHNISNLCDNKNVKFHCFNPCKKQPLGTSPVSTPTNSNGVLPFDQKNQAALRIKFPTFPQSEIPIAP